MAGPGRAIDDTRNKTTTEDRGYGESLISLEEYKNAESLEDLKNMMVVRGVDLSPSLLEGAYNFNYSDADLRLHKAYKKAKRDWWDLNRKEFNDEVEELPSITIEKGDKTYHLHGIAHSLKGIGLSQEVKQFLHDEIESYLDQDHAVFVEQEFYEEATEEYSHRKNFRELSDFDLAGMERPFAMSKETLKNLALYPLHLSMDYASMIADSLGLDVSDYRSRDMKTTATAALEDKDRFKDVQNVARSNLLPLQLEEDYHRRFSPSEGFFIFGKSKLQAQEMLLDPLTDKHDEAHLIVGASHQQVIAEYMEKMLDREVEFLNDLGRSFGLKTSLSFVRPNFESGKY